MIVQVLAVYDAKTKAFMQPFFSQSIGSAYRSFKEAVDDQDPRNNFNKYKEDFSLFHLGEFDDNLGIFRNLEKHELVATALQVSAPVPMPKVENVVSLVKEAE